MADEEKETVGGPASAGQDADSAAEPAAATLNQAAESGLGGAPPPPAADASTTIVASTEGTAEGGGAPQNQGAEPEIDESAYKVTLPSFHGPLDLLLHLIRKHKVDIYDIPILLITEQYNAYLEAMESLDLDIAADYIYMAALLINIKSRMLLPRDENADEGLDDPRKELVDRLLEYQRFKAVAETFAELDVLRMGMWSRPATPLPGTDASEIDMSEVSLFDLIDAFRTALNRYKQNHPQAIELQRMVHKVSDKMRELYEKLLEKSPIRLQWFLEGRDRNELIALFLGTLELVRLGGISLQQSDLFGEILIGKTEKLVTEETFKMFDNS